MAVCNTSCNSTCNITLLHLPDQYWTQTFGFLCAVVAVLATIENSIVIMVIHKNKILQTPSNRILLSLAVSNFLTGIILAPIYVAQLLSTSVIGNCTVDMVRRYLSAVLLGSALLTVGFISYDRCLHLLYLKSYKMPRKKMISILLVCWLIPILIPFLRFVKDGGDEVYAVVVIILGSVTLTVIVISYVALLVSLKRHTQHTDNKMFRTHMSNERRAGKTVIIIVSISFLCGVPLLIYFGMVLGGQRDKIFLAKSYIFVMFLSMLNAVFKPLVYCYRTPLLRKYTKRLFGMKSEGRGVKARYNPGNKVSLGTIRTFTTNS